MGDYVTKVIPFTMELAEMILRGEAKNCEVQTREGLKARLLATDINDVEPVAAAVTCVNGTETVDTFYRDGTFYEDSKHSDYDLVIQVKTFYRDYKNFRPTIYQACLVRDVCGWREAVCIGWQGNDPDLTPVWLSCKARIASKFEAIPMTANTIGILGKDISYEEYVNEQMRDIPLNKLIEND